MKDINLLWILTVIIFKLSHGDVDDYWSDDFDENKNCKEEELINQLKVNKTIGRCASKSSGNDEIQWEECKKELSEELVESCMPLTIKRTGDLHYCKNRGQTSCCFHNQACDKDMEEISNKMLNKSLKFLINPKKFFTNLVDNLGYDTCHPIKEYDASECHRDCIKLEKSSFAKNCTENNGLFKCCIRRDKEFCHECRFCCTLSVCTTPKGTYFIDSQNISIHVNSKNNMNAKNGFQMDMKMWKNPDFRCLKPKNDVKPEKWPHYEMVGYRAAKTKKELKKVKEIKIDKYFFNLEDPEVWKHFKNKKKGPKLWKKTYGFDYASIVKQRKGFSNNTICFIDCFKAEQRSFARKCKKKGGLFKCCVISLRMDKFELVRYRLKKQGLIKEGPSHKTRKCQTGKFRDCSMCGATYICAKKDLLTGLTKEIFKTPYKTHHKIGGRFPGKGLKYFGCFVQNTCNKIGVGQLDLTYEPLTKYQKAANKEDFCNLTQIVKFTDPRNETFQKSYYKECMKQVSPNVFICPNNTDFQIEDKAMAGVTQILRNLEKNVKIKKKSIKKKSFKKKSTIKKSSKSSKIKLKKDKHKKHKHKKKSKSKKKKRNYIKERKKKKH